MAESKQNMRDSANFIVSTEADGSVSHQRVGKLFNDIIDWLGDSPGGGGGSSYPSPTRSDTYLHWDGNSYNWQTPSGGTAQLGGFLSSLNSFTQPTSVQTGYLHYNGNSGQLEWTDIPSGSGITEAQMWTSLVSKAKWWGRNLTKVTDNDYQVKGSLSGDIDFIEFKNGVKLGIDTQNNNTLKVFRDDSAQANFYATGGVSALGYDASGGGGGGGGLTSGSWAEYLNGKQKSGSDPEASKYLHLKSDGTVEWADGGGGSFEPNDLVGSLNTTAGMPTSGQILVYRGAGWAYEDKPTGGGSGGGEMNVIDAITFNGNPVPVSNKVAAITANIPSKVSDLTNDAGYINDVSNKLDVTAFTNAKWWGQTVQTIDGKYVVQGDMEAGTAGGGIKGFHSIELNTNDTAYPGIGGFIDFHVGGQEQGVPDYTARIIEDSLGILHIESMTKEETLQKAGLHVGQNFKDSFVQIGNVKLVYDGDSAIRVEKSDGTAAHFYATGGVSALGIQPEVTGLESFTISHLKSTDIEIAENTSIQDNDTDELKVITKNSEIKFTVNVNNYSDDRKPSLIVREEGIMAKNTLNGVNEPGIFYFDSNHWLYIDSSGNLKYHKGSEGDKTVVLQ